MTPPYSPFTLRKSGSLAFLPAVLTACVLATGLMACGPDGDHVSGGQAAPANPKTGQQAGNPSGAEAPSFRNGPPIVEGASSKGVLEIVDPEDPERPLFKDFGKVPYGTDISWYTVMENTGTEPVIIRSAQAACGCTRFMDFTVTDAAGNSPDRPTSFAAAENRNIATIPVGGQIKMRMKLFTASTKPNRRKLALMRVSTNSQLHPYMTFEVSLLSSRLFIFAPDSANLTNSPISGGKSKRIKILVDSAGDPERVLGIVSTPDGIEAELITETFAGEYVWYVNVSVLPLTPLGPIRGDVVLSTTDADGNGDKGRLKLPVIASVVPDVIASPSHVSFRAFDRSVGAQFTGLLAALVPGARVKIKSARFEGEHADKFSVEYTPIKAFDDGRAIEWNFTAKLDPGYPAGYIAGSLVFELEESIGGLPESQPKNEIHVPLSGVARDPASSN